MKKVEIQQQTAPRIPLQQEKRRATTEQFSTSLKGAIAETKIVAELTSIGVICSRPVTDCGYDLITDLDGELTRVQVKYVAAHDESHMRVPTSRPKRSTKQNGYSRTDYEDEIDAFAIYCPDNDGCYWLPIEDATTTVTQLRFTPALKQSKDEHSHGKRLLNPCDLGP